LPPLMPTFFFIFFVDTLPRVWQCGQIICD
jgi:hypothetical protein